MNQENLLTLKVGGQIFAGWKTVDITTSIEQLAGTYKLDITERWPNQPKDWVIPPGEYCEIGIGDDTVISGYVDSVVVRYNASSHEIRINGRDRSGDLVDCSAPSQAFKNQTFEQIANLLCAPYGISIYDETVKGKKPSKKQGKSGEKEDAPQKPRTVRPIANFACQNGETVFKSLEKLARSEGVLLVSDGEGGLLITRAGLSGSCKTILEFGKNILSADYENSFVTLHSEIIVKGQARAARAKQFDASNAASKGTVKRQTQQNSGKSSQSQIHRYRPLIIVAENQADSARCQQRAEWEASNREAKSRKVTITVQGWREEENGELWRINKMVRVKCPWMRMDEWWLISAVNFKLDEGGTTAVLTLVKDKAFTELSDIPAPKSGAKDKKYQE